MVPIHSHGPMRSSLFPRWGYLDKFAVNEYMARAFLVTALACAAGTLLGRSWPHGPPAQAVAHRGVRPLSIVDWGPMPSIVTRPAPAARGGGASRHAWPHPQPVPVDCVAGDADIGAGAGGGVEDAGGLATGADPADFVAEVVLPHADVHVPVEREAEIVSIRASEYPEIAREAGIEGTVWVRVLVGADGYVVAAQVIEGVRGLDEAALAAARSGVFRPATQQGRAVAVWVVVPIEFRLRGL